MASPCSQITKEDALLVIDVQNDFLAERPASQRSPLGPKSPLYPIPPSERDPKNGYIKGGSLAVPDSAVVVNRTQEWYSAFEGKAMLAASQDWHPPNHCSFCRNGTAKGNPQGFHPHGAVCFSGEDVPTSRMNATNRCHDGESELLWKEDEYVQWPDHCLQGGFGSRFDPYLDVPSSTTIVRKGLDKELDSYSAFGGVIASGQGSAAVDGEAPKNLYDWLTAASVRRLWVLGLALDYCVQQSTLDALGANPGTGRKAPPTLTDVILVRSATAAVNVTAGEERVKDIVKAGGHVVTAVAVQDAIEQFCAGA